MTNVFKLLAATAAALVLLPAGAKANDLREVMAPSESVLRLRPSECTMLAHNKDISSMCQQVAFVRLKNAINIFFEDKSERYGWSYIFRRYGDMGDPARVEVENMSLFADDKRTTIDGQGYCDLSEKTRTICVFRSTSSRIYATTAFHPSRQSFLPNLP